MAKVYLEQTWNFHVSYKNTPAMEPVDALAGISRSALCCHSNETHAPIAHPLNSAQLQDSPYHSPSYIRVRVVVWECGDGQTDRHAVRRDQYTFRLGYTSRQM